MYLYPIDKFNYLHALLEGQAARAMQGLTLSGSSYKAAVDWQNPADNIGTYG